MAQEIDDLIDRRLESHRQLKRYRRLFITGCPKSGTTWLMTTLDGHPAIVANGEGRFAWRLFGHLRNAVEAFNADQAAASPLGAVTGDDFTIMLRTAADNTLMRYLTASGKPPESVAVVADKTPQHVLSADLLADLYPGCSFINIVRDPRDAATSALFHLAKGDPRPRHEYVAAFIGQSWRMHVEAALDAERRMGAARFLNVRYEDLHADPDTWVRRCLLHLGVDASASAVAACRRAGSFERMSGGRRRGEVNPNALCRNGLVGDWRNHIPTDVALAACAPVADLMRHFGYAAQDAVRTDLERLARASSLVATARAKVLLRAAARHATPTAIAA